MLAEEYYDYRDPLSADQQNGRLVERSSLLGEPANAAAVASHREAMDKQLSERLEPVR